MDYNIEYDKKYMCQKTYKTIQSLEPGTSWNYFSGQSIHIPMAVKRAVRVAYVDGIGSPTTKRIRNMEYDFIFQRRK